MIRWTMDGQLISTADVTGMTSPVHCTHCDLLVDDRGETGWKSRADYVRLEAK